MDRTGPNVIAKYESSLRTILPDAWSTKRLRGHVDAANNAVISVRRGGHGMSSGNRIIRGVIQVSAGNAPVLAKKQSGDEIEMTTQNSTSKTSARFSSAEFLTRQLLAARTRAMLSAMIIAFEPSGMNLAKPCSACVSRFTRPVSTSSRSAVDPSRISKPAIFIPRRHFRSRSDGIPKPVPEHSLVADSLEKNNLA